MKMGRLKKKDAYEFSLQQIQKFGSGYKRD